PVLSFFSLSRPPPPPPSTLFPYTTLFRSLLAGRQVHDRDFGELIAAQLACQPAFMHDQDTVANAEDLFKIAGDHQQSEAGLLMIDRKSTRLNSSHLVISYAVFCLKKKKKK